MTLGSIQPLTEISIRTYFNKCTMHLYILFLLQPTNAQIYITIFSLFRMFTPTCFNTSVSVSEVKVLELHDHNTEVSKYVGMKII